MAQWLFFGPILVATCGFFVLDHRHKWTGTSRTLSEKVAWQPTGISRDQQGSGLLNSPAVKKTPHDLKLDVELYHENALIYIYNYIYTYTCNLYTICPYWAMIANPFNAPGLWIQSGLVFITCASFSPEKIWNGFEWFSHLIFESYGVYPLVNVSVAMENPHFWCINELNGHVQRQTVSHYQRVTV